MAISSSFLIAFLILSIAFFKDSSLIPHSFIPKSCGLVGLKNSLFSFFVLTPRLFNKISIILLIPVVPLIPFLSNISHSNSLLFMPLYYHSDNSDAFGYLGRYN